MTNSEKLDQVLSELQQVKIELAQIKNTQPTFSLAASEPSVAISFGNDSCPNCGAMQYLPVDSSIVAVLPNVEPSTTFSPDFGQEPFPPSP